VALKFYCKLERVGCAAGGEVVDIKYLKKVEGLPKYKRKARILRNWRVQTVCLVACLSILPLSILMLQLGLEPFIDSMTDIQDINDIVESRSFRAIQIITQLQDSHKQLLAFRRNSSSSIQTTLKMENICPDFDPSLVILPNSNASITIMTTTTTDIDLKGLLGFDPDTVRKHVEAAYDQVTAYMKYDTKATKDTIYQVTDFTQAVDMGIDSFYSHDWIIRMGVVILDVVVLFLAFGIFLTKHSIDYPAYQRLTTWVLVPLFCGAMAACVVGTCVFLSMGIANAGTC